MKILFTSNYPSPYRVDFFNELGKSCDVTVLFEEKPEQQIHRNQNWFKNNFQYFKVIFLKQYNIINKKISLDICKHLSRDKFDIIVVCNYSTLSGILAISYMKVKKISFAIEIDGAIVKNEVSIKEKLKCKLKKYLISSAHWWFSTSSMADDYYLRYGAKRDHIYRYPFSSFKEEDIVEKPIDYFHKEYLKKRLGISESKVILSIGQFIYRKGFDILLDACKSMPRDVGIYIIGGTPYEELESQREMLQLDNVHFLEFKKSEILKLYYDASDVFVLPTREDIWGLVVNEAMAHGLPVITTNKCVSGVELIEDGVNGYIVSVNDHKNLSLRLTNLINDDKLRYEMGVANINRIKNHTIENMTKIHSAIFKEIQTKS